MSRPTKPKSRGDRPRLALVLSGGGARGAYEAGILRYLREDLAGDLGGHAQFDIISGTSVGGIHACFVAGTCDVPSRQGRMLAERWEGMAWPSARAHSHILSALPAGSFPGVDDVDIYEFLDQHADE